MDTVTLDIYVDEYCDTCKAAERLAAEVREWFPAIEVLIHRLGTGLSLPKGIIAVPAFLLNGRLIQYGTPQRPQLGQAVLDALHLNRADSTA